MPFVHVQYKGESYMQDGGDDLAKQLPEIIAQHLHIEPQTISIRCEKNKLVTHDTQDFEITILATDIPERKSLLEMHKETIRLEAYARLKKFYGHHIEVKMYA